MRKTTFIALLASLWWGWSLSTWVRAEQGTSQDLWAAARAGDVEKISGLVSAGADVNAKTKYGATALSFACSRGHLDVAKLLIDAGADVDVKDTFYKVTPLTWAMWKSDTETVKLLVTRGAKDVDAALSTFVNRKDLDVVRCILDAGNASDDAIRRALSVAEAKQATELVEVLKTKAEELAPLPKTEPVDVALLDRYTGTFESARRLRAEITHKDGQLVVVSGGNESPLESLSPTKFKHATMDFEFELQDDKVVAFSQRSSFGTFRFERVDPSSQISKPELPELSHEVAAELIVDDQRVSSPNWPQFRGTEARGVADGQRPPLKWDVAKSRNVKWKTTIPGLGHSSPVIWGDRIYITTAISAEGKNDLRIGLYGDVASFEDESVHEYVVLCLQKDTGDVIWQRTAAEGIPDVKRHLKSTHANPSPVTDGEHVVCLFASYGMHCYDREGQRLWKKDLGRLDSGWFYDSDFEWGFGSSPILFGKLVIIQCDIQHDSFIAAFDVQTGEEVWRSERDEIPTWSTPTVYESADGPLLLTNGTYFVRGYDAETGTQLWQLGGNSEIVVPTPFASNGLIFVASGYSPVQPIHAIRQNARGDITPDEDGKSRGLAWTTERGGPYMPTPIAYRDLLYTCSNSGILTCYHARTGQEVYRRRLKGAGTLSFVAAPVAGDGHLYLTSEDGNVYVVKAGRKFEQLHVNPLGEYCLSTPAISEGVLFLRGQRHLVAVEQKQSVTELKALEEEEAEEGPEQADQEEANES